MTNLSLSEETLFSYRNALESAMKEENLLLRENLLETLQLSTQGNPQLDAIFLNATSPAEAEAHFHIVENNEGSKHAANALAVSDFIRGLANAVNECAKKILGLKKRKPGLNIVAFAEGSLDIVLQVPPQPVKGKQEENIGNEGVEDQEPAESLALNSVADIFSAASDSSIEESEFEEKIMALPAAARQALNGIAKLTQQSKWNITGEVRRKTGAENRIDFTNSGATRLTNTLESIPTQPEPEQLIGYIDGYRRSERILYFKETKEARKSIQIEVQEGQLIQQVAEYATTFEHQYRLSVLKIENTDNFGDIRKVTRILRSISKVPLATQDVLIE